MARKQECSTCKFYNLDDQLMGWCRRYPPVFHPSDDLTGSEAVHPAYYAQFPRVDPDDWCGEFKPRKD